MELTVLTSGVIFLSQNWMAISWVSYGNIFVSLAWQIRQETQRDGLILLFCKATLTESCKSEIIFLPSSILQPKKLGKIFCEALAPPIIQLWTMLSVI